MWVFGSCVAVSARVLFLLFSLCLSGGDEAQPERLDQVAVRYNVETGEQMPARQESPSSGGAAAAAGGGSSSSSGGVGGEGGNQHQLALVAADNFVFRQPRSVRQSALQINRQPDQIMLANGDVDMEEEE